MKENLVKKIELFANIAIIVVALVIGAVLVKKYFFSEQQNQPKETISVGSKVNLNQVDWAKNGHTLLLVLSKECRYCAESIPFYQKLGKELSQNAKVKLIAAFPEDKSVAGEYLQSNNVAVSEIYQVSAPSLGVRGTPTILLINEKGEVVENWLGKLPESDEKKVFERLKSVS